MWKNIVIAVLLVACGYFVYGEQAQKAAFRAGEISVAEYGGLAALREILPAEVYRKVFVPELEAAAADGAITREELEAMKEKLNVSLPELLLAFAHEESAEESFSRFLNDTREGAGQLGESLDRGIRRGLEELGKALNPGGGQLPENPSGQPDSERPEIPQGDASAVGHL